LNSLAQQGTYQAGYSQGGNGGSLAITAPVVALDATLKGNTTAGAQQTTLSPAYDATMPTTHTTTGVSAWLVNAFNLPMPSELSITYSRQELSAVSNTYVSYSPTPADITFTTDLITANATSVDSRTGLSLLDSAEASFDSTGSYNFITARNHKLYLSPDLFNNKTGSGFGGLTIDDGRTYLDVVG
jgi:hypothetical protein